ncbi:MAG TPA: hypothetical protein VM286_00025 [Candidatus Thermoplasmatota archaeon]|nr:hypothetical protein [Candidatus Thermoplasmatota archaeon]
MNGPRGLPLLPTQEIGSLPKTLWRLQALEGAGIRPEALLEASSEAARLGIDPTPLLAILQEGGRLTPAQKQEVKQWASRYSLRWLEESGLDIVYDGEETRTEMYDWPVARTDGFEPRGWCRSWDHLWFRKAAVVRPPACKEPYHVDEYLHASRHASRPLKVPVTGAYTLMDWSFDEHYFPKAQGGSVQERLKASRRDFALDLAKDVLHPNLEALVAAGATRIQVDEPGASTKPDEVDVFVDSFNASVRGLDARFSVHLCFSDYGLFFPGILALRGCQELAIELANKDSWGLGVRPQDRPGYAPTLALWEGHDAPFDIGLGVLDVHTDRIEPPELVRDRILFAADALGPERVLVNPDCGLRTRRWPVVQAKLRSLVDGTALARQQLGLGPEGFARAPAPLPA